MCDSLIFGIVGYFEQHGNTIDRLLADGFGSDFGRILTSWKVMVLIGSSSWTFHGGSLCMVSRTIPSELSCQ